MLKALGVDADVAALEVELGESFAKDEGARFVHRARVDALIESAIAKRSFAEIAPIFGQAGVTWSVYRKLHESLAQESRLFGENPIFSGVIHAGGDAYPTPGSAARIPSDERRPAAASPRNGEHSDELLSTLLGMSGFDEAAVVEWQAAVGRQAVRKVLSASF
jgi:2-methylfumaryl-CoA isomerase